MNWRAWAGSLTLGGFGLLAVLSGNPLTLLLAWASLDLVELPILLAQVKESAVHERAVIAFAARVGSLALLMWADVAARAVGKLLTFDAIPLQASPFILLAAGLRLGVLPFHLPFLQEPPLRRGLGTSLRLVPAAASLVLLTRVASVGVPEEFIPYFLVMVSLSALYGAGAWAFASDELNGRPFWILGMASLSVAAAVLAQPSACLAWGLACIFSGGVLFLYSARHPYLLILPFFGLLGFSALPFTPAWDGMRLVLPLSSFPIFPFFLLAHALLVLGYIRHTWRAGDPLTGTERWAQLIYPLGLALLLISYFWIQVPGILDHQSANNFLVWAGGGLTLGLAALLWLWIQRGPRLPQRIVSVGSRLLSLGWFYRLLWVVYRSVGWFVSILTRVFEGEGGILWALVALALLVTFLLGINLGV
jgi:uncharacterized membrane protein YecN with MAPEG domain